MNNQNIKERLFDKEKYYEHVTRLVRWFVIGLVAVTFPIDSPNAPIVFGLVVAAAIYNGLRYSKRLRKWAPFGSFISVNAVDNLFVAVLVGLSGGLGSPYYLLFLMMIFTSAYWFGYKGLVPLAIFHLTLLFVFQSFVNTQPAPVGFQAYELTFIILIVMGILTERLTYAEREDRFATKKANQQIESERNRLLALFNSIGDAVISIDNDGKITEYNGAALELLNTNQQLHGESINDYLMLYKQEDDKEVVVDIVELANESSGVMKRDDLVFHADDESELNIDITVSPVQPIRNSSNKAGFILILRDITKRKTLEEQRDEFISVTSHELRTPIAIAEANISTALTEKLKPKNEQTAQLLKTAHENVTFLASLVNDLGTLARAEKDMLDVEIEAIDTNELIKNLVDDYKEEAQGKGLKLYGTTDDEVNTILSSRVHIHEILQNFITNSLKYTKEGEIEVHAGIDEDGKSVVFSVRDTGIGISQSDQRKIFEKFYRSEDYRTRETGGTGLGLYITQRLAGRLGGKIWFDSKLNEGSTFYLKVPPSSTQKEDQDKVVKAEVDDFVKAL